MSIILWALRIFLAVVFAWHGWLYLASSDAALNAWHEKQHPGGKPLGVPTALRRFIGLCELLAAPGLIFPVFTGILPWLTPLAAAGLTLVMIGSAVFHGLRHENANVVISAALVAVCVVVMYGTGVQIAQATTYAVQLVAR